MVIRSKRLAWAAVLYMAVLAPERAHAADPMMDSFASGSRSTRKPPKAVAAPTTKPASPTKSTTTKTTTKSSTTNATKAATKAATKGATKTSKSTNKNSGATASKTKAKPVDDEFADDASAESEKPLPAPRREAPDASDSSRSRPSKRHVADTDDSTTASDASEDAEEKPKAKKSSSATRPVAAKLIEKKREKKKAKQDEDEESESEGEGEGEGDEDDDADASDAAFASLPVILPRVVSVGLGGALMGRSFRFAAPAQLQHESSFPRIGFAADLETFPLLLLPSGWWRQIGLGAFYASEPIGQASVADPASGMSVNTPAKQTRWGIDARIAMPLGERLVVTPAVGFQALSFTLSTKTPIMASACTSTTTSACLPDTDIKLFAVGAHVRVAATSALGLSIGGAYMVGLGVKNKPVNAIGYEIATSASGFEVQGGATYMLNGWLAVRAVVPVTRISYAFHPSSSTAATLNYRAATELYYGLSAGVVLFTR